MPIVFPVGHAIFPEIHKWVLTTHNLTSNLSMEALENDHQLIVFCVMLLSIRTGKLLADYAATL